MAHEKNTTRSKMLHVQNIQKIDYVKEMKEKKAKKSKIYDQKKYARIGHVCKVNVHRSHVQPIIKS